MAELWTRAPIMQGKTEQGQLTLITQLCGSITPEVWPLVKDLKLYKKMELCTDQKRKVKDRLKRYVRDNHACDLLEQLLMLDPSKRMKADDALDHQFFWTNPMPFNLGKMLAIHEHSMFIYLKSEKKVNPKIPKLSTSAVADSGYQERVY